MNVLTPIFTNSMWICRYSRKKAMNSTATNVGGWLASEMRIYANGEFFDKLPIDLQKVIIDT